MSEAIYADRETRDRIRILAERQGRSQIEIIRRALDNNFDLLSPFEQAVIFQVAKDEGLDTPVEAVGDVIREWATLKASLPALSNDRQAGRQYLPVQL